MKKFLALMLGVTIILGSPISSFGQTAVSQKEEVVYGILGLDGSVDNIYVVNIFEDSEIVDYGDYDRLTNMTSSDEIIQEADKIKIKTTAPRLYYEGTLKDKQLPWNIQIDYLLDGKAIPGQELAGKSGALEIRLLVQENPEVNNHFFNQYALQIGLNLDTKLADNIRATNATIAEAGSKKQLTYTVLPGEGIKTSVLADVTNFETDAITINGIKMNLGFDIDYDAFTGEFSEFTDAIGQLDGGAQDLLSGANDLEKGMKEFTKGLKAFKDGIGGLGSGVKEINTGAQELSQGLLGLDKQKSGLADGAAQIKQATFASVNDQLEKMNLNLPPLTPENYQGVLEGIEELAAVKEQLKGVVVFADGLNAYMGGLSSISEGAADLAQGTKALSASVSNMPGLANELYQAGEALNAGIKKLRLGLEDYKAGTKELRSGTADIDSQISSSIDEIIGGIAGESGETKSFVSDKNTDVLAVQFVMRTEAIKRPEVVAEKSVKQELSFFEKLMNLFK